MALNKLKKQKACLQENHWASRSDEITKKDSNVPQLEQMNLRLLHSISARAD